ncbi:hypothetical protein MUG84_15230 [Paenibacillus sp. KQZ6P-2]|uniref:DUF2269 domain-containing protein n=1 Tax=Paenibacillus mangrovi TaxID=2931978 RepID=A0A9X1WQA8_9BACL|nr:hypothetical protein [Paenibacillus mangrovi]MCJ8013088.1 hypothetical protein [Paenibacillus mangrovi]
MFGFMLFLHFAGLLAWVGGLIVIIVMIGMLSKQLGLSQDSNLLARRTVSVFSYLAHPGAVLVLGSGLYLILNMGSGSKPLWLSIMEMGGGTIALLFLIITGILGSKVKKKLKAAHGQPVKVTGYLTTMTAFMVLVLGVVLVVSLKI